MSSIYIAREQSDLLRVHDRRQPELAADRGLSPRLRLALATAQRSPAMIGLAIEDWLPTEHGGLATIICWLPIT